MKALKRLKQHYYNRRADVFLLSYPKCGRTWLRLMVGDIMERHYGCRRENPLQLHKLANRRRGIPCIVALHDWRTAPDVAGEADIEPDKSRFRGRRVLLMVRHPCDVVVSNYFQKVFREEKFSGSLSEFLRHPTWGIEAVVRYYNIWARDLTLTRSFYLLRYEDLRTDPNGYLPQALEFLGISGVSETVIDEVIKEHSFENTKKRERSGVWESRGLKPRDTANPASYKARSGRMGGYRDELSTDDRDYAENVVRDQLATYFNDYRRSVEA